MKQPAIPPTTVVITSIFAPTVAVQEIARRPGLQLIVVGDCKTPQDWHCDGVQYLSLGAQQQLHPQLATLIPHNHYARKMMGYLQAIYHGAQTIVDTDDDNIPLADWSFPPTQGCFEATPPGLGFINVYQRYTRAPIWPRGLPLVHVLQGADWLQRLSQQNVRVAIWQALSHGEPDVDAIYRLVIGQPCNFEDGNPVVLRPGTACPFNSQNTWFASEAFALLYIPAYVSFRFCDILRGLVAQPILWQHGLHLGFTQATVRQERNPHNLMHDFESELTMHQHSSRILDIVQAAIQPGQSMTSQLHAAYCALVRHQIVPDTEVALLECWLKALADTDAAQAR
ncbi:MAG: STELLO glycosyltransferase family protein [Rhodoferax sp.]|nr:STELLO glycosyltransferase family protein [Rhodoferax sp.]